MVSTQRGSVAVLRRVTAKQGRVAQHVTAEKPRPGNPETVRAPPSPTVTSCGCMGEAWGIDHTGLSNSRASGQLLMGGGDMKAQEEDPGLDTKASGGAE